MWKVGVVGCGYWGPNLVRNFVMADVTEVLQVADKEAERMNLIKDLFPAIETTTDAEDIFTNPDIDIVAIATPVFSHYPLAKRALEEGKHVLIEKPLASTSAQAQELVDLAEAKGVQLFVDHTFIFTPAVQMLKKMIDNDELGEIQYYDSKRINLGLYQPDISVIWDIGPHDVSILQYLLDSDPLEVSAVASCHVGDERELYDLAYMSMKFPGNTFGHATLSWLSPIKSRTILIGGTKKMVVFDELDNAAKIKVYDVGAEVAKGTHLEELEKSLVQYRRGDMYAPNIGGKEAIRAEVEYIVSCLENNEKNPINSGIRGVANVKTLELAEKSAKSGGAFLKLE